jgi:hypothetical protein
MVRTAKKRSRTMNTARSVLIGKAFCAVIVMSVIAISFSLKRDWSDWRPDSEIYLWMTVRDNGASDEVALDVARRFMVQENRLYDPDMSTARLMYTDHAPSWWTAQFSLFRNRPLYPLLAVILYPRLGPFALKVISGISIVLVAGFMFGILLQLTSPLRAAVGVAALELQRLVLFSAAMALTDALALLLWTISLGSAILYYRRPAWFFLVSLFCASAALTLTRPAFYLPLGASLGAYFAMRRSHRLLTAISPLATTGLVAILYFCYDAAIHGPSALTQIRWEYNFSQEQHHSLINQGPLIWYVTAVLEGGANMLATALLDLGGFALVVFATLGAVRRFSSNALVCICVVAAAVDLLALLLNPINPGRPILLPLAPLVVILCVIEFEELWPSGSQDSPLCRVEPT